MASEEPQDVDQTSAPAKPSLPLKPVGVRSAEEKERDNKLGEEGKEAEDKEQKRFYQIASRKGQPKPQLNQQLLREARQRGTRDVVEAKAAPKWLPGFIANPWEEFLRSEARKGKHANLGDFFKHYQREIINALCVVVALLSLAGIALVLMSKEESAAPAPLTRAEVTAAEDKARGEAQAAFEKAVLARAERRYEDALAALAEAKKAFPLFPGLLYQEALIRRSMGDNAQAQVLLHKSIEIGEATANARVMLATQKVISPRTQFNLNRAAESADYLFEEAVKADPGNPNAYFVWGVFLRKEGKNDAAIEKLKLSRTLSGRSDSILMHDILIALAMEDLGQENEARQGAAGLTLMLLDAARATETGDREKAVAILEEVRRLLPLPVFVTLLGDPAFRGLRGHPSLRELMQMEAPEASPAADSTPGSPTAGG